MKKKARLGRIAAVALFCALAAAVLFITGRIIRAKFIGDSTTIVNGFYSEKKNDVDMIIIGSSNSFCTINPVVLYENYGIAAYDFGSSSQPLNISLLYLKEALKRQNPKVVAFETNMLLGGSGRKNEEALRWGLTDMPLSLDKLKCIYQSVGAVNAEYFSYVFPVFRYHNRWRELTKTDYTYFYQDKTNYAKGYLETGSVYEGEINLDDYFSEGEAWISDENMAYFDEMARLCEKEGVELLLFKSPKEEWYSYDTELIYELAEKYDIPFLDYNELYHAGEVELDLAQDFRDMLHLNNYGAKKVTMHFGEYVCRNYDMPDRRNDEGQNSWDLALMYMERRDNRDFELAQSAGECLKLLQGDENYVLIVTDAGKNSGSRVRQWVYENGKVRLDKTWEKDGVVHMRIGGDSELALIKRKKLYQVIVDDVGQYEAGHRWNIVIYDKITKGVVGSLYFDE